MYAVKVYTGSLLYKDRINPKDIVGDFKFSGNINSSLGPITITVKKSFGSLEYQGGDVIRVFAIDEFNKTGKLVYGGVISKVIRKGDETKELIELYCLGYSQLMFYTPIETIDTTDRLPQDIVQDIIDAMNLKYPGYFYLKSITPTINLVSYGKNKFTSALENINLLVSRIKGWSWYIGQDGGLVIGEKPTEPTHKLTYRKDISEITVEEDSTNIVNKAIVEYSTALTNATPGFAQFTTTVSDISSILQYGERTKYIGGEIKVVDGDLQFIGPIGIDAGNNLGESSLIVEPQKTTTIKVNNKYDYFNIKPFDTITVKNINYEIKNLQVLKVTYGKGFATLEVESLQNLGTIGRDYL